jgi:hypothetical protein
MPLFNSTMRRGTSGTALSAPMRPTPWGDFAETFAHYMIDTLETAHAFGIRIKVDLSVRVTGYRYAQ